jgi:hypothetical protein
MAVWPADETGPSYWVSPAGTSHLRASDADRERAVDILRGAFVEGRLSNDEYHERVSQAYAGRTYGDLTRLIADLPAPPPPSRPVRRPTNALAVVSLICGIIQPLTFGITMIPAIFLGHAARRQIRKTGEGGGGFATAGLVLGWVGAVLAALTALGLLVAVAATHVHNGPTGFTGPPLGPGRGPAFFGP